MLIKEREPPDGKVRTTPWCSSTVLLGKRGAVSRWVIEGDAVVDEGKEAATAVRAGAVAADGGVVWQGLEGGGGGQLAGKEEAWEARRLPTRFRKK